jgi:hypothetical protein
LPIYTFHHRYLENLVHFIACEVHLLISVNAIIFQKVSVLTQICIKVLEKYKYTLEYWRIQKTEYGNTTENCYNTLTQLNFRPHTATAIKAVAAAAVIVVAVVVVAA